MLETLLACGPQGWQLHVGVEPGPEQPAFRAICAAVLPEGSFHVHENRQRLGVNGNPYQLICTRFREGADFVLALEEDLELAPDALALARRITSYNVCYTKLLRAKMALARAGLRRMPGMLRALVDHLQIGRV